jgi:hypothetical protein
MILYLETNFIMSLARGQEPRARDVLHVPDSQVRIVLPAICLMEAWSVFEKARSTDKAFIKNLYQRAEQLRRDLISPQSKILAGVLVQARNEQTAALSDAEQSFHAALRAIAGRCELIAASAAAVERSLISRDLPFERDSLIFATIHEHAQANAAEERILLTDDRDYKAPAEAAGLKFFARAEAFLGWFDSSG